MKTFLNTKTLILVAAAAGVYYLWRKKQDVDKQKEEVLAGAVNETSKKMADAIGLAVAPQHFWQPQTAAKTTFEG